MENSPSTSQPISRRNFLRAAVTAPVGVALAPSAMAETAATVAPNAPEQKPPLPTRQLGKNGPQVSMLILGGDMPAHSPEFLDLGWFMGIRYFDTAEKYGNGKDETHIAEFLTRHPERRRELFLVSKDYPRQGPEQLLTQIDTRLARCNTNYLDLFFIHQLCTQIYGEDSVNWPKSDQFKKVAEQLKSSGKCKLVGFSCHGGPEFIQAAADGGFVDVVMVQYTPFYERGGAFDRALTACHEKGIGIIAMKTLRHVGEIPKRLPEFDQLGLTTHQALLHAVWSDPRISAICNSMHNLEQMGSSVAAARSYKTPLKTAHLERLRETVLAGRRTFCPGCPACHAAARETGFAFQDIARFVTYYEQDGWLEARVQYRALPTAARDASGVDLAGLRERCAFGIDYPEIAKRAQRYFA